MPQGEDGQGGCAQQLRRADRFTLRSQVDMVGLPLLDHVYVTVQGKTLSLRERGFFDEVPSMGRVIAEAALDIVRERGIPGYVDEPAPEPPTPTWVWGRRR